jgi:hypothetical protein
MYNEPSALKELQSLVQQLYGIGQKTKIYQLIIHTLIFQAKLAVIEGQFEKAINLLNQGLLITEENELLQLKDKVQEEIDQLTSQETFWQSMSQDNVPMNERIENVNIQDSITTLRSLNIPKYVDQIPRQLMEEIQKSKEKPFDQ